MIDNELEVGLIKNGRAFSGIEVRIKEGSGDLARRYCSSFADEMFTENAHVRCLKDGRIALYNREFKNYRNPGLAVNPDIAREIGRLRPKDWVCVPEDGGFRLIPKQYVAETSVKHDEFVIGLMKEDGRISGIRVEARPGASLLAGFFVKSFIRYCYGHEADIYAHKGKIYFRHFCFRFCDSPSLELDEADFSQLEKALASGGSWRYRQMNTSFELLL